MRKKMKIANLIIIILFVILFTSIGKEYKVSILFFGALVLICIFAGLLIAVCISCIMKHFKQ